MSFVNKIKIRFIPKSIIEKSNLFDSAWYEEKYLIPRDKAANHYLKEGYKNGCEPSSKFSGEDYYLCNPDTRIMNPLLHYETYGKDENRILKVHRVSSDITCPNSSGNIRKSYVLKTKEKKHYKKCAIFAMYSIDETIPEYVVYYISKIKKFVDGIILVADSYIADENEINKIIDYVDYAEFDRHTSFDFGSYKKGIDYLKKEGLLKDIEELYLINDSCYGPVTDFDVVINKMNNTKCDFWGLLDSDDENQYHLLSFFYCFKNKVINDPYFYNFFLNKVIKNMSFDYAVFELERKFTNYLKEKYTCACYMSNFCDNSLESFAGMCNATVWPLELLKNNFPLVKIKALDGRFNLDIHNDANEVLNYIKNTNYELYLIINQDLYRRKKMGLTNVSYNSFSIMDKKRIISFDIFDTLIIRPFSSPDILFEYIENKYRIDGFHTNRIYAEIRARQKRKDKEVTFDEIYSQMPERFKPFKKIELQEEMNMCRQNPRVMNFYNYAVKTGAKLIAISDMYLSKETLLALLQKCGFHEIEDVFVSCEYRKTKGTGSLYREVIKYYNVEPKTIFHIGDNEKSDIEAANSIGIDTYRVRNIIDNFINAPSSVKYSLYWNDNKSFQSSIYMSMLAKRYEQTDSMFDSYYSELGYSLGGPLALGYLNYICREAKENKIDLLLFAARDGYILKYLYEKYFKDKYRIRCEYAYLTRATILSSTLNYHDEERYLKTILIMAKKSISDINIHQNYDDNKKEFKKYKKDILNWANNNKRNLYNHLKKICGSSKNIAVVDMTTYYFTSAIGAKDIIGDRVKMGIFSGTFNVRTTITNETFCKRVLTPEDVEMLEISETLITSPEPPIIGVDDKGAPVYQTIFDKDREERYYRITEGIEKYISDFLDIFDLEDYNLMNFDQWLRLCSYFKKYMNIVDKKELSKIIHSVEPIYGIENKRIA